MGRKPWASSLRFKATALGITLATLPVFVVGALAFWITNATLTAAIEETRLDEIREVQTLFSQVITSSRINLNVIANLPLFTDAELRASTSRRQKRATLLSYSQQAGVYGLIAVINRDGSSLIQSEGDPLPDQGNQPYFQTVLETGEYLAGQPFPLPTSAAVAGWAIPLAVPVRDSDSNEIVAVVYAELLMRSVDSRLQGAFIAEEGKGYAFTRGDGTIFLAQDPNLEGQNVESYIPAFATLAATEDENLILGQDPVSGVSRIETYLPLQVEGLEDTWSVVVTSPASVVFAARRQLLLLTASSVLATAVGVGILAAWLSARAIQPILRATATVVRLGQGDLGTRLPVQGEDELALLSSNINGMANQIQQLLSTLQVNAEQLEQANTTITEESQLLQADVGQLLEVVLAVEEGNLEAEAEVSDRATGLVADTFNRLVEQLIRILSQVLTTTEQVAQGADQLRLLSSQVAENATGQARDVVRALTLTQEVQSAAQVASMETMKATESLNEVGTAVTAGQTTIQSLTREISTLQAGTDLIVQRMKALGEFVGLADQFVQDQGQIASMTQVLALNATLVAARAAEQRDPRQFAVVAREFEAIADQVSALAQQTNESLETLQQRTDQIHAVVTGVDSEVQRLAGLVSRFTSGVEESQQVFNEIRSRAQVLVQVGEGVAESSQGILSAADTTTNLMAQVATLADLTMDLSQGSQKQAVEMERLSRALLNNIRFFRLPSPAILPEIETGSEAEEDSSSSDSPLPSDSVLMV
ncbi:MAG: HAMP domain-containing protein [Synechococcaceae cyanobacterium SM2_3_1]|nr:HAMP domain-containing protein [Synechococcaceae cyanobacterium SM2_3_1]